MQLLTALLCVFATLTGTSCVYFSDGTMRLREVRKLTRKRTAVFGGRVPTRVQGFVCSVALFQVHVVRK